MNVSIGPTTKVGWGASLAGLVAAGITYLTGDHTAQSVTAVEIAGGSLLVGCITQAGRYLQSHALAKKP